LTRAVAAVLALVWLGSGKMAVFLGATRGRWQLLFLGPLAIWYGTLWVRVARTGRRLELRRRGR
jgi:hypothetical protein